MSPQDPPPTQQRRGRREAAERGVAERGVAERSVARAAADGRRRRVTIADVAARAGVSQVTVSLLLKGRTEVCSVRTAERIRAAVELLGYVPPAAPDRGAHVAPVIAVRPLPPGPAVAPPSPRLPAGGVQVRPAVRATVPSNPSPPPPSLPEGESSVTLGICLSPPPGGGAWHPAGEGGMPAASAAAWPFASAVRAQSLDHLLRGAQAACDEEGGRLLLFPPSARSVRDLREAYLAGAISGLILLAECPDDPRPALLAAEGVPLVLLGRASDTAPPGCSTIHTAGADVAELALSHLWRQGHRHIAYLGGPTPACGPAAEGAAGVGHSDARRRAEGFLGWMEQRRQQPAAGSLLASAGPWSHPELPRALLRGWLQGGSGRVDVDGGEPGPSVTAIFCGEEGAAADLLAAAREEGVRIPGDLSLVGVDADAGPLGRATDPSLTCVELPQRLVGRRAVETLLRTIRHRRTAARRGTAVEAVAWHLVVPVTRLAVRGSTGPPAAR